MDAVQLGPVEVVAHQVAALGGEELQVYFLDLGRQDQRQAEAGAYDARQTVFDDAVFGEQRFERGWDVLEVGLGGVVQEGLHGQPVPHQLAGQDAVLGDRVEDAALAGEAAFVRQAVGDVEDVDALGLRVDEDPSAAPSPGDTTTAPTATAGTPKPIKTPVTIATPSAVPTAPITAPPTIAPPAPIKKLAIT